MTRTGIKLALGAAMVVAVAGCVYEPAPYAYAPAPAYYGYGPTYYGAPAASLNFGWRGGGGWHHGDRD
jgi:hypothetical protein